MPFSELSLYSTLHSVSLSVSACIVYDPTDSVLSLFRWHSYFTHLLCDVPSSNHLSLLYLLLHDMSLCCLSVSLFRHPLACELSLIFLPVLLLLLPHCTENRIYVIPKKELRGLIPNSIYERYIFSQDLLQLFISPKQAFIDFFMYKYTKTMSWIAFFQKCTYRFPIDPPIWLQHK